jgi:hypothetical protein
MLRDMIFAASCLSITWETVYTFEFWIHLLVFAWNSSFELQRLHIDPVNGKYVKTKEEG